jgi:hypothetical protein
MQAQTVKETVQEPKQCHILKSLKKERNPDLKHSGLKDSSEEIEIYYVRRSGLQRQAPILSGKE